MDVERIIDEIEQLQEMFEAPDIRPLSASDLWLGIGDTMRRSRTALGFASGSGIASVAALSPQKCDEGIKRVRAKSLKAGWRLLRSSTGRGNTPI